MTVSELAEIVGRNPQVITAYTGPTGTGIGPLLSPTERQEALKEHVPMVVDDLNTAHDWDFNTHFTDLTSVADQAVYTVSDFRDVISVQYGEDADTLDTLLERPPVARDDYVNTVGVSGVEFWSPYEPTNNNPQIELVGAPTEAGNLIRVRTRKNITITDFPKGFDSVLVLGLLSVIVPAYNSRYQDKLSFMAKRHQGAGREENRVTIDPAQEARNIHNNGLGGY